MKRPKLHAGSARFRYRYCMRCGCSTDGSNLCERCAKEIERALESGKIDNTATIDMYERRLEKYKELCRKE